jgi:HemY protein
MVAVFAIALLTATIVFLWSVLRSVLRAPDLISMFLRRRRGTKGYLAISRGLIAIGTGDARAARKFAQEARRLAPGEPLALLLSAQTAQLSGDRAAAERAFAEMARRPDTKLLGLRGLFVEAQRRDDRIAARAYAEEAAKSGSSPGWAGHAVLEFRCAAGDWTGALAALESNLRSGLIDRATYRRQRAVLLAARAMAVETDRDAAKAFALEAVKLVPTLVPAAVLAGRFLAEGGELRKAGRIIDYAWRANPHPDLAETYAHLRFGDSARDRLVRVETLAKKAPGNIEAALALARAALDAREFGKARAALAPFLIQPTRRVALMMAEIEEVEHGDDGRAREWMARAVHAARDPAWTADGFVSERWLPVSPVSGRLDAFEWKIPLAELNAPDAARDVGGRHAAMIDAPRAKPVPRAAEAVIEEKPAADVPPASAPRARATAPADAKRARKQKVEAVIPLVHAPDDPGPDSDSDREPVPEPSPEAGSKLHQFLK